MVFALQVYSIAQLAPDSAHFGFRGNAFKIIWFFIYRFFKDSLVFNKKKSSSSNCESNIHNVI